MDTLEQKMEDVKVTNEAKPKKQKQNKEGKVKKDKQNDKGGHPVEVIFCFSLYVKQ